MRSKRCAVQKPGNHLKMITGPLLCYLFLLLFVFFVFKTSKMSIYKWFMMNVSKKNDFFPLTVARSMIEVCPKRDAFPNGEILF